jgi:hypothetical protein
MRCLQYDYAATRLRQAKLDRDGLIKVRKKVCRTVAAPSTVKHIYDIITGHFDIERTETLIEMSKHLKTVIPLRHPAAIATSWKKREGRPNHKTTWYDQWLNMCEVENAFHFPLETKPFSELEKFTGTRVYHYDQVMASIGDYPEKKDLKTMRDFLGKEWSFVEKALNTNIGRRFYDNTNLRGLRCP